MDLFGSDGEDGLLLRRQRKKAHVLAPGVLIRDQRPMPPGALASCLRDELQPEDWYELLNTKVFFWLDPSRAYRQRKACGPSPQIMLTLDACRLLEDYAFAAAVTPFNTGNARRKAVSRGLSTFVPYKDWRTSGWSSERGPGLTPRAVSHRPVELVIADAVPNAMDYVIESRTLAFNQPCEVSF